MKQKIKIKCGDKVDSYETEIRNEMHFDIQRRNRLQVQKNKKAYSRKIKHKKDFE